MLFLIKIFFSASKPFAYFFEYGVCVVERGELLFFVMKNLLLQYSLYEFLDIEELALMEDFASFCCGYRYSSVLGWRILVMSLFLFLSLSSFEDDVVLSKSIF